MKPQAFSLRTVAPRGDVLRAALAGWIVMSALPVGRTGNVPH